MVTVKVLRPFLDLVEDVDRRGGDTFAASLSRAEEIARKLPGYIEIHQADEPADDLSSLSIAQLKRLASERGVKPSGTKKADYIAALEG